jgi:predicted HNH restriction endonuclease
MAFRCGKGGYEMWEKCLDLGVAAITYGPLTDIDLSKYGKFEPRKYWKDLAPAQKVSLKRFAYKFKVGDIIYTKKGTMIVGRGIVSGKYRFVKNTTLSCPNNKEYWHHQIPVKWENDFIPIKILLGAEQFTVVPLDTSQVNSIFKEVTKAKKIEKINEVNEGNKYKKEVTFRKRNRAIIEAKKLNSDGTCEVCKFNFSKFYKGISKNHLVAHHLYPFALRNKARITRIEDIALVCSNCHFTIHSENPIIGIKVLSERVIKKYRDK